MTGAAYTINEFREDFPDDSACLDHLWRRLSPDGHVAPCPKCGVIRRFHRVTSRRSYSCDSCGHHLHPSAGTIFHGSSTPLHVWFLAVFLMTRPGEAISVKRLERELGVNYKTAARMAGLIKAEMTASFLDNRRNGATGRSTVLGEITDFAGSGAAVGGDGGAAIEAPLNGLHGIAVDAAGNVYLADMGNHVVRKVDAFGMISTVAGRGAAGWSGDGGPALAAQLDTPCGVAIDDAGDLLITELGNHVVRKVDDRGTIRTVAGVGVPGHSGDGGPARRARLNGCHRVLPVGEKLYISEYAGNAVRVVDGFGIITTFAGNGSRVSSGDGGQAMFAGLPRPAGLAHDPDGNVYVAQADDSAPDSRVRRIDASGRITTFAGTGEPGFAGDGGPAVAALLHNPVDLLVDSSGALLISDYFNNRVRRVDRSGTIVTIAGSRVRNAVMPLALPIGLAVSRSGDLLIVDSGNRRVRRHGGPLAV